MRSWRPQPHKHFPPWALTQNSPLCVQAVFKPQSLFTVDVVSQTILAGPRVRLLWLKLAREPV